MNKDEQFTIRVLASRTRVSPHTILYYGRRGLLPKARRSPAGYRLFSAESIRRIRFILQAKALGFSLKGIKEILALRTQSGATCVDVHELVEAKAADIDAQLRALRAARRRLASLASQCSRRRPLSRCPILQQFEGEGAAVRQSKPV